MEGLKEGTREAAEDASRFAKETGEKMNSAGRGALDGAVCILDGAVCIL